MWSWNSSHKLAGMYNSFCTGVGAGPGLAGPLEHHSNPTHGLHVLLTGPLFEAVLRHCFAISY